MTWTNVFSSGAKRVRLWANNYPTDTPAFDGMMTLNSTINVENPSIYPFNTTHLTVDVDVNGEITVRSSDHAFGNSGYGAICTVDLASPSAIDARITAIAKNTDVAFDHSYDELIKVYDGVSHGVAQVSVTYVLGLVPATDLGMSVVYPGYTGGGPGLGSMPFLLQTFSVEVDIPPPPPPPSVPMKRLQFEVQMTSAPEGG